MEEQCGTQRVVSGLQSGWCWMNRKNYARSINVQIWVISFVKTIQVNSIKTISILFWFSLFIQIDFNISLEESGIVVQFSGTEGGVARDKEAVTILDNPETRNTFINELMEVWRKCSMHCFVMSSQCVCCSLSAHPSGSFLLDLLHLSRKKYICCSILLQYYQLYWGNVVLASILLDLI